MQTTLCGDSNTIFFGNKKFEAVQCEKCGAKMYPRSLLSTHISHHEREERWYQKELRDIRHATENLSIA